jgi:hypothetical protein
MELSSQENYQEKTVEERINNYIITFQAQKITHNGVEGYFIPIHGWNQLTYTLRYIKVGRLCCKEF